MKTKLKKLTAVLMVTFIVALSLPIQSFAAFDRLSIPVIKSIEVNEKSCSISLKELDNYYDYIFEQLEKQGITLEELKQIIPAFPEHFLNFYLYSSGFEYLFDVTLVSGKKYTLSACDYVEINKLYSLEIDSYITYDNYLSAKENGDDKIQVEVNGCFYNNFTYEYCDIIGYASKCTLPLTKMVVKSITPLSGIPAKIYPDAVYDDIEGAEFLIEYADGTTVKDKVKNDVTVDSEFPENYILDGNAIYVYSSNDFLFEPESTTGEYRFEYLDAVCTSPAVFSETSLFKSVKITDCIFDGETVGLSSLTYELTYEDGRSVSFTKSFTAQDAINLSLGQRINIIDGYVVSAYLTLGEYDIGNDMTNADYYSLDIYVGDNTDSYKIDNPHKDIFNKALNIISVFRRMISKIRNFIYSFFGIAFYDV